MSVLDEIAVDYMSDVDVDESPEEGEITYDKHLADLRRALIQTQIIRHLPQMSLDMMAFIYRAMQKEMQNK